MSDPIGKIKSSGGTVDAYFSDDFWKLPVARLVGVCDEKTAKVQQKGDGSGTYASVDTGMSLWTGSNALVMVDVMGSDHLDDIDYIRINNAADQGTVHTIGEGTKNLEPFMVSCVKYINQSMRILVSFAVPYEEMESKDITIRYAIIKTDGNLIRMLPSVEERTIDYAIAMDNNGYVTYLSQEDGATGHHATCTSRILVKKGDRFYARCGMGQVQVDPDRFNAWFIVDSGNKILRKGPWVFDGEIEITEDDADAIVFTNYTSQYPELTFMRLTPTNRYLRSLAESNARPQLNKGISRIFRKVICCGDSYTAGYVDNGTVYPTNEDYAWPAYMSMITGQRWLNCGDSGETTKRWLTAERGLPYCKTLGKAQAYVIGLMINDNDFSDPTKGLQTGTSADIGTDADTYYAWLSRDVRELHALNNDAIIFINTCPKSGSDYDEKNQAVRDVASAYHDTYHTHCIDLAANSDLYQESTLTQDYLSGHYTAIGYEQFAEIYNYLLSVYIGKHIEEFQDVFLIPFDDEPIP